MRRAIEIAPEEIGRTLEAHSGKGNRARWKVLASGWLGSGTGFGLFALSSNVFIVPMQAEFGWSRATLAIGPIVNIAMTMTSPVAGLAIDRFGARPWALFGLLSLSACFVALAVVPANPLIFYGIVATLSIACAFSQPMIFAKGVASWYTTRVGTAIGIMMSGCSIIAVLAVPLLTGVIHIQGWRAGYIALAGIILVVGLPPVLAWFRERPVTAPDAVHMGPMAKGARLSDAAVDRRFWLLVAFLVAAGMPCGALMSQLQPVLLDRALDITAAAALGSVYVLSAGLGRIAVGVLMDLYRPSLIAAACMVLAALGTMILFAYDPLEWASAALAVALIGLAQGAELDFIAFFTVRIFGLRAYAALSGILSGFVGAAIGLGGLLFAVLQGHFGNYAYALLIAAAAFLVAALLILLLPVPASDAGREPA